MLLKQSISRKEVYQLLMYFVPQMPRKVQYILDSSFPLVTKLCKKTHKELFVGGRKGYDRERLFTWLLVKKVTNWSYRDIADMAGVSHPTLLRANDLFLKKGVYEKVFSNLVKKAYKQKLLKGRTVAMDSSFVHTFSRKGELGSEGWNGFKEAYGFKLHLLMDTETKFPISIRITNGLAADCTLAIPLLKKGKSLLKNCAYVLADKGYDDQDIVKWVSYELKAKAGIPMRKKSKLAKGKKNRYGNLLNWILKAHGRTFKKSIYNKRTAVERIFSVLKRTYHLGHEETRGILNFAKNVYLSLICYTLKLFNNALSI